MYATIHLFLLTRSVWEDRESSLPFLGIAVGAWEHGSLPPRENKYVKEKISSHLIYGFAVFKYTRVVSRGTLDGLQVE